MNYKVPFGQQMDVTPDQSHGDYELLSQSENSAPKPSNIMGAEEQYTKPEVRKGDRIASVAALVRIQLICVLTQLSSSEVFVAR